MLTGQSLLCISIVVINYLPSSFTIVTVAELESPTITLLGSEDELMVRVKFSLSSIVVSLAIITLKVTRVCPAINMTVYGPEP